MSSIYGFWQGPTYRPSTREEQWQTALDLPMSMGATAVDQSTGEFIGTYGIGTIIQEMQLPPAAPGRWYGDTDESYADRRKDYDTLTEEEYKASPYFRENLPWDNGMTKDRAAALAMNYDAKRVREHFASKRPITSFIAGIAGQALDPINYIPVLGPSVRAAAVARMGVVKGIAATAALDAAANTAIAGLVTRETRRGFGDDVSWQAMVSEIATAALLGTAFGTVGGLLERRAGVRADALRREAEVKVNTLRATQEARIALNEAIGGLANDGEVRLSPNGVAPIDRVAQDVAATPAAVPTLRSQDAAISPQDVSAPVLSFVTEKGSVYQSFGDGTTIRDKAARDTPGHEGDSGIKPRTQKTVYVDTNAAELSAAGLSGLGEKGARVAIKDGKAALLTWNRQRQAWGTIAKNVTVHSEPAIGRYPLELWKVADDVPGFEAYRGMHAGNKITSLTPVAQTLAPRRPVDASPARPEPPPAGRAEAEAKVAKPENYKALADQYRVDPEAGTFPEEAELRQLAQAGRLSDEDMAVLDDADAAFQDGVSYGEALRSVVGCLV